MRRTTLLFLLLVLFAAAFAGACSSGGDDATPAEASIPAPPEAAPDIAEATEDNPGFMTVAQIPPGPALDQNCIDCHSSAEMLQQLAVEEEEAESLNEGSG